MRILSLSELKEEMANVDVIRNVVLELDVDDITKLSSNSISIPSIEDYKERKFFEDKLDECKKLLSNKESLRRAVVCNTYSNTVLGKCPSLAHFWIEDKILNMTIYMRSCNYFDNFNYDLNTFSLLLIELSKKLNIYYGKIFIIFNDLHKRS